MAWFCVFSFLIMCVLFFVVIAVVVFQGSMIALGDFSAYNNTEVFLCENPSLFSVVNFHDSTKGIVAKLNYENLLHKMKITR